MKKGAADIPNKWLDPQSSSLMTHSKVNELVELPRPVILLPPKNVTYMKKNVRRRRVLGTKYKD